MNDKSKRENHWFVAGSFLQVYRLVKPRTLVLVVWLTAMALMVFIFLADVPPVPEVLVRAARSPAMLGAFMFLFFALLMGARVWLLKTRRARVLPEYLKSLAAPGPEPLIELIDRSASMS